MFTYTCVKTAIRQRISFSTLAASFSFQKGCTRWHGSHVQPTRTRGVRNRFFFFRRESEIISRLSHFLLPLASWFGHPQPFSSCPHTKSLSPFLTMEDDCALCEVHTSSLELSSLYREGWGSEPRWQWRQGKDQKSCGKYWNRQKSLSFFCLSFLFSFSSLLAVRRTIYPMELLLIALVTGHLARMSPLKVFVTSLRSVGGRSRWLNIHRSIPVSDVTQFFSLHCIASVAPVCTSIF